MAITDKQTHKLDKTTCGALKSIGLGTVIQTMQTDLDTAEASLVTAEADVSALQAVAPTADEKAALAGSGTPAASNKFLTTDTLTTHTGTAAAHHTNANDPTSDEKAGLAANSPTAINPVATAAEITTHAGVATAHHTNANDPTSDEKAALAGTSGSPSGANKFVTDADTRLSSGWITAEDLDWTAEGAVDWKAAGDGLKTVNGKTWYVDNTANADVFAITANGLEMEPNTNNTAYGIGLRNCPVIAALVSNLFSGYDPGAHLLRVWTYFSADTIAQNWDYLGGGFEAYRQAVRSLHTIYHKYHDGVVKVKWVYGDSNAYFQTSVVDVTDNVFMIEQLSPGIVAVYSGTYAAGFPAKSAMTLRGVEQIYKTTTVSFWRADEMAIVLCILSQNASGNAAVTYARTLLEYREF